ncbi:YiiX family permuted papain-like enzyme [Flavobacterium hydatis]|uniref:Peptidoglycan peptidase n=1 Tax=Flavobacterium hydatis TaxID=991 RepID=A0A086A4W3_FLAHY|nr:YiiX family permuted papain-like enzyme [Flavobacterium hydatis]KFF11727.1 peptidoglycan peptidase [Flavobacterium hydatis]OXA88437.1 peptidoglycan peptidase [Flavobacterium hydatis]
MKKFKYIFAGVTLIISFCFALYITKQFFPNNPFSKTTTENPKLKENLLDKIHAGDLIFQTSESSQCEAVRIATKSKFSHCGIVYILDGKRFVFEAVQPVRLTPLDEWIQHGKDQNYLVKRLKDTTALTPTTIEKMEIYSRNFLNSDYDPHFGWSDAKMYCSELIWKIYKNGADIELCPLQKLKDFNLEDPRVKAILKERYGNNIPLEEDVVAPSNIVDSKLLKTVIDTY